jgi:hypothetical protein
MKSEVREAIAKARVADGGLLRVQSLADLRAEEAAAPPARWLVQNWLRSDDYGAYAAAPKVGKTWLATELAVSGTTGTRLFGRYPMDQIRVLLFAGEGGRGRVLRRLDAIARERGIDLGDIDGLRVSLKAPQVTTDDVRHAIADELEAFPADLILGEPFYLMGRGVGRGQLNEIGAVLGACQELAQDADAALFVGDHWNKGGQGIGADRITGAGMHEWSRVVINGMLEDRRVDVVTKETLADVRWDVSGEMADIGFKMRRLVRPDDPDDPNSRLVYRCDFLGEHDPGTTSMLSEDAMKLLMEMRAQGADETRPAWAKDVRARAGVDTKRATDAWQELEIAGRIDSTPRSNGRSFQVWMTEGED